MRSILVATVFSASCNTNIFADNTGRSRRRNADNNINDNIADICNSRRTCETDGNNDARYHCGNTALPLR